MLLHSRWATVNTAYYCIATFLFQETHLWQQWTVQKEYSNDRKVLNFVTYSLEQIITWGAGIPGRALANIVELLYLYIYNARCRLYDIVMHIVLEYVRRYAQGSVKWFGSELIVSLDSGRLGL